MGSPGELGQAEDSHPCLYSFDSECLAGSDTFKIAYPCFPGPALTFTKGFPLGGRTSTLRVTCLRYSFQFQEGISSRASVLVAIKTIPFPTLQ